MTPRTHRSLFALCLAALLLTVPAWAAAQLQCKDTSSTLMWEVKGQNSTVHLFGSLHLGDPSFYPLPKKVEVAFREADHLVFEVDPRSMETPQAQGRMLQLGSLAPGEKLSDQVSPEVIKALESRLRGLGVPPESVMNFRPWFITLMLSSLQFTTLGYLPQYGVEQYVRREAPDTAGILALETFEEQLSYLQHLDGEAFLAFTLASFDEGQQLAGDLVRAWRCADKPELIALLNESFEGEVPAGINLEQLKRILVTDRNKIMADGIVEYLQKGKGSYFVVVGSAHYLGEGSIVDLLRKAGYEVTPIVL